MQFLGIGFLVLLFLEIMSVVWVADWLGGGWTLLLMIASFFTGLFMLRRFGLSGVLLAAAGARSGGQVSLYQLLWPIRYAVAALMLMSPGFASTLVALLLMLPVKGKPIAQNGGGASFGGGFGPGRRGQGDIIEGEFTVEDPAGKPQTPERVIEHKRD